MSEFKLQRRPLFEILGEPLATEVKALITAAREEGRREGLALLREAMELVDVISGSGEGMLRHEPYASMKKRIDEALA